jgi:hypothetical protein
VERLACKSMRSVLIKDVRNHIELIVASKLHMIIASYSRGHDDSDHPYRNNDNNETQPS